MSAKSCGTMRSFAGTTAEYTEQSPPDNITAGQIGLMHDPRDSGYPETTKKTIKNNARAVLE